uniref:Uncharacterized protein n=1 Tax=Anguilla anguilla TaxID=7936 RepID=A0A0E9PED3_ANGAN
MQWCQNNLEGCSVCGQFCLPVNQHPGLENKASGLFSQSTDRNHRNAENPSRHCGPPGTGMCGLMKCGLGR